MRHRSRRPKKSSGRIVAQCTRWDPLGWGFCVPNDQPNRSIYVHCTRVVGAGEGFVKLHKYAMYEFNVLPPEPGKRYERATDITLPGGEPIPLEPKVLRNIMIEERKKQETHSNSEPFFSSRSTSDGGHDSSFQSDDLKQRDNSSELSHEAESIELSRSTAETVEYEHHRRYPPGLGGKYARDRRKAQMTKANYREPKYNYLETKPNLGREDNLRFVEPKHTKPPESAWKDIPSHLPNLETEWSPVTDSLPNINPPPKYNLNFACQRDHAIWGSKNESESIWSPIYFDSVLKDEERRPVKDHEIPWDPVITRTERKVWEPVLVDSKSPWSSAV